MHSTVYSVYYIDIRHLQCPVGVAIPAMLQIRCNYPSESGAHFSFVCRDLFIESQQQQLSSALFVCGGNGSAADREGIYMLNLPIKTGRKESYSYKLYTSAENKHETLDFFPMLE